MKKWIIILIVTLMLIPATRVNGQNSCSLPSYLLEDLSLAKTQAAIDISKSIDASPDIAENYVLRGTLLFEIELDNYATDNYEAAIRLNPQDSMAFILKGNVLFFSGDYHGAIASYMQAEQVASDNVDQLYEAYIMHTDSLLALEEYDSVTVTLEAAIELKPTDARAYALMGFLSDQLGDLVGATDNWNRALSLNLDIASYFVKNAVQYFERDNYTQATNNLNRAIHLSEEHPTTTASAYYLLGKVYAGEGSYEQSLAALNEAIDLDSNCAPMYVARGTTHNLLGNFDLALEDFNQALELDPTYFPAYNGRSVSYSYLGYDDLSAQDRDYLTEQTANSDLHFLVLTGNLFIELKDYESARLTFITVFILKPTYSGAVIALGDLYRLQGRNDLELEIYLEYVRIVGENLADPIIISRIQELESGSG
ncbi:MAG: tetratricopeptide repeat protein [Anaerolineae bacterium]|nr:tetratricopeptide repeat protein [Anaerolineae bacterium]